MSRLLAMNSRPSDGREAVLAELFIVAGVEVAERVDMAVSNSLRRSRSCLLRARSARGAGTTGSSGSTRVIPRSVTAAPGCFRPRSSGGSGRSSAGTGDTIQTVNPRCPADGHLSSFDTRGGTDGRREPRRVARTTRGRARSASRPIVAEIERIERDTLSEASGENNYRDHMADQGTATFERELDMTLEENASESLLEVVQALARIDAGSYGTCARCGHEIPSRGSRPYPTASLCISCKEAEESRSVSVATPVPRLRRRRCSSSSSSTRSAKALVRAQLVAGETDQAHSRVFSTDARPEQRRCVRHPVRQAAHLHRGDVSRA